MVPGTWLSGLFFVVLVAPGLLFDLLSERRRAGVAESTFREISRVVLASVAFSGLSLAILAVGRAVVPSWLPDPRQLFFGGDLASYLAGHYRLVLRALVAEVAIALLAAVGLHLILTRRAGGATIRFVSPWTKVFRHECPAGYRPEARVRLNDGTMYVGAVGHFTSDLEPEGRELVLVPPLWSKSPTDATLAAVPEEWQRIVIRATNIDSLTVRYWPES